MPRGDRDWRIGSERRHDWATGVDEGGSMAGLRSAGDWTTNAMIECAATAREWMISERARVGSPGGLPVSTTCEAWA